MSQASLETGFTGTSRATNAVTTRPSQALDASKTQQVVAQPQASLSAAYVSQPLSSRIQEASLFGAIILFFGAALTLASNLISKKLDVAAFATSSSQEETTYHFLVANAKFMLFDEEHGMELLREKRRFLKEKNIPRDFWIVPEPEFLSQMPDIDQRVLKPSCALVSTDERWILFMKLRYDKVLMGSFKGSSDPAKALATKGGDALAVVPKWEVPADWAKNVPYPKYSDDWFHPFLVNPPK